MLGTLLIAAHPSTPALQTENLCQNTTASAKSAHKVMALAAESGTTFFAHGGRITVSRARVPEFRSVKLQ